VQTAIFSRKNTNYAGIFDFFTAKPCKFEKFVVNLQPELDKATNYIGK